MDRRKFLKAVTFLPLLALNPAEARNVQWNPSQPAARRGILLLETTVAGYRFYEGERVWEKLRQGDALELRREPSNPHDHRAIALYWNGAKLGYIPRVDNTVLANFLDNGFGLEAGIKAKNPGSQPWEKLEVRVSLGEYHA